MEFTARIGRGRRPAIPHPHRERAHARPAILNAARTLFRDEAYQSISVERIAAFAGVTRYTLNNHFSSKEEIFKLSREALLIETVDKIEEGIPVRMEVLDAILYFLEHCFEVFSSSSNLELVGSIVRDDGQQLWLVEAHQRRVRLRLMRNCETYILYRARRADVSLCNPQIIAEQLIVLAESTIYGPYFKVGGNAQPPIWRAKHFNVAARAIAAMLKNAQDGADFPHGADIGNESIQIS